MARDLKETLDPQEQAEADELARDLALLLELPAGRNVLFWLLSQCGIYQTCFTGNSTTFFAEGQRSIGLRLVNELNRADPTAYPRMLLRRGEEIQGRQAMEANETEEDDNV